MSYTISEDAIPDEMIGHQDGPDWISYGVDKVQVANILRDAIRYGLVSPPVWVLRGKHSRASPEGTVWADKSLAELASIPSDVIEHYTGQRLEREIKEVASGAGRVDGSNA